MRPAFAQRGKKVRSITPHATLLAVHEIRASQPTLIATQSASDRCWGQIRSRDRFDWQALGTSGLHEQVFRQRVLSEPLTIVVRSIHPVKQDGATLNLGVLRCERTGTPEGS